MNQTSELRYFPCVEQQKVNSKNKMLHICDCPVCCPLLEAWLDQNSPKQKENRSDNSKKVRFEGSRLPFWQHLPVTDYWKDSYCWSRSISSSGTRRYRTGSGRTHLLPGFNRAKPKRKHAHRSSLCNFPAAHKDSQLLSSAHFCTCLDRRQCMTKTRAPCRLLRMVKIYATTMASFWNRNAPNTHIRPKIHVWAIAVTVKALGRGQKPLWIKIFVHLARSLSLSSWVK